MVTSLQVTRSFFGKGGQHLCVSGAKTKILPGSLISATEVSEIPEGERLS